MNSACMLFFFAQCSNESIILVMVIRVVEFSSGDTKLERFLAKNQHTQRNFMNFENWCNGELSKIGHNFSNNVILKKVLSKNINNKKCAPKFVFLNEKIIEKDIYDF